MSDTCRIGELSREFAVTPRAIRFYEDEGLLAPRRNGRSRIYGPRERVRLKLIVRGRRLGFSLSEIRELLDLYDGPNGPQSQLERFLAKLTEHRDTLLAQRGEIDVVLAEMRQLERRCQRILESR